MKHIKIKPFQKNNMKSNIPWVEKYRPTELEQIVLSDLNFLILNEISDLDSPPNLLFYGPPGTGKTTTILNLVKKFSFFSNDLVIHLNASDERGVDIVRNQLTQFVNSNNLFSNGKKIVILDEVDYMTIQAQQLLKTLIQMSKGKVVFCLICNYISKIDSSLQKELLDFKFNKLPKDDIINFLNTICNKEEINVNTQILEYIQQGFDSDIRSMINYLQVNQHFLSERFIMNYENYEILLNKILDVSIELTDIYSYINELVGLYNINKKQLLINLIHYIIKNKKSELKLVKNSLNGLQYIKEYSYNEEKYYAKYLMNILRT